MKTKRILRAWIVISNNRKSALEAILSVIPSREKAGKIPPAITYRENGSPYLTGLKKRGWHISISHSHRLTAMALSAKPIGIDIERVRLPSRWKQIAKRFFSLSDHQRLLKPSRKEKTCSRLFSKLWTNLEASHKLYHKGVFRTLTSTQKRALQINHRFIKIEGEVFSLSIATMESPSKKGSPQKLQPLKCD